MNTAANCHAGAGGPNEFRNLSATKQHVVAVVGPPNSGKSTLFNALTGLRQKVANFPGVTVEHHSVVAARLDQDYIDMRVAASDLLDVVVQTGVDKRAEDLAANQRYPLIADRVA